jgi:hypothetical protein
MYRFHDLLTAVAWVYRCIVSPGLSCRRRGNRMVCVLEPSWIGCGQPRPGGLSALGWQRLHKRGAIRCGMWAMPLERSGLP